MKTTIIMLALIIVIGCSKKEDPAPAPVVLAPVVVPPPTSITIGGHYILEGLGMSYDFDAAQSTFIQKNGTNKFQGRFTWDQKTLIFYDSLYLKRIVYDSVVIEKAGQFMSYEIGYKPFYGGTYTRHTIINGDRFIRP